MTGDGERGRSETEEGGGGISNTKMVERNSMRISTLALNLKQKLQRSQCAVIRSGTLQIRRCSPTVLASLLTQQSKSTNQSPFIHLISMKPRSQNLDLATKVYIIPSHSSTSCRLNGTSLAFNGAVAVQHIYSSRQLPKQVAGINTNKQCSDTYAWPFPTRFGVGLR